jgi:hypothetical protein
VSNAAFIRKGVVIYVGGYFGRQTKDTGAYRPALDHAHHHKHRRHKGRRMSWGPPDPVEFPALQAPDPRALDPGTRRVVRSGGLSSWRWCVTQGPAGVRWVVRKVG